jgi:hypothetical protein
MNSQIKQRWIDALHSDEYKQGESQLRDADRFCCLGVLCDLYINETNRGWMKDNFGMFYVEDDFMEETEVLPDCVKKWAELEVNSPSVVIKHPFIDNEKKIEQLVNLNDGGVSFSEIADLIEESL